MLYHLFSTKKTPPLHKGSLSRRQILQTSGVLLISVLTTARAHAKQILAVRVWPARDYTRVTLEHDGEIKATHFLVKDPDRLVVDIEGLTLNSTLKEIVAQIQTNDPYIKQVRAGQNKPNVVRLVFDLKEEINPQVFDLEPVGRYKHRLVFDLYPTQAIDPIEELIKKETQKSTNNDEKNHPINTNPYPPKKSDENTDSSQNDKISAARKITIALDPGHGGEDPGAMGNMGHKEKDIVLAIAKRLKNKLEKNGKYRVMLTRDGDYFVPLQNRVSKARAVQADLMISIHADAFVEPSARGSSVFVLSEKGASSTAAKWLAKKENEADLIGGINLRAQDKQLAGVLLDLTTTAQINDSLKLGRFVLKEIGRINRLHKSFVEQAGFAVLKAPDIPSILIETAFISNPEEEQRLSDETYQDKMADSIVAGIHQYFEKNPPLAKNSFSDKNSMKKKG